jgi:1-acyl-sn-glycerol-3-phosphate acyltransferase
MITTAREPGGADMREELLAAIVDFLAGQDLLTLEEIRAALETELDAAPADALALLKERLTMDAGWGYYPPDPLARRIHHLLADRFLERQSEISGLEHMAAVGGAPLVLVANHLSYADANVVEVLLHRSGGSGGAAVANRLVALAGPKVFTDRQRRFSSLCFGTIKVPQSADVSSGEAMLGGREVARAARQAIDAAYGRLDAGDALLLFAEGTRSRTGAMRPMLPGASRYLERPGTCVIPVALAGSETLFPIGAATVRPARATIRLGIPLRADALMAAAGGSRKLAIDAIAVAIADLLPDSYRGAYADRGALAAAVRVLEHAMPEPRPAAPHRPTRASS